MGNIIRRTHTIDYNTLIRGIIEDQLYTTQPLKRIVLCYDNNQLYQVITNTDNHGYFYTVNERGELFKK